MAQESNQRCQSRTPGTRLTEPLTGRCALGGDAKAALAEGRIGFAVQVPGGPSCAPVSCRVGHEDSDCTAYLKDAAAFTGVGTQRVECQPNDEFGNICVWNECSGDNQAAGRAECSRLHLMEGLVCDNGFCAHEEVPRVNAYAQRGIDDAQMRTVLGAMPRCRPECAAGQLCVFEGLGQANPSTHCLDRNCPHGSQLIGDACRFPCSAERSCPGNQDCDQGGFCKLKTFYGSP